MGSIKPWECVSCSNTCKKMGVLGSLMYNTEVSNREGKYGYGETKPIEGAPQQYNTLLRYRSSASPKPDDLVEPICRTCADMCNAIEDPPRDVRQMDNPEEVWTIGQRNRIHEYFIQMRTEEWERKVGLRDKNK